MAGNPNCSRPHRPGLCAWGSAQQLWDPAGQRAVLQFGLAAEVTNSTGCDGGSDLYGTYQAVSTDRGASWGELQDVQSKYMPGQSTCMGPTSGNGLRLREGGPFGGRVLTTQVHNAYKGDVVLLSDTSGRAWNASLGLLQPGLDEGQLAQLPNGSVINIIRNCWQGTARQCALKDHGGGRRRGRGRGKQPKSEDAPAQPKKTLLAYSISTSGGETWSAVRRHPDLVTPVCKPTVLGYNGSVYFVGPYSETGRVNLTVLASDDNAATFTRRLLLVPGAAGYSSLQCGLGVPGGDCGVLWVRDHKDVHFMRFDPNDVTAGGAAPARKDPPLKTDGADDGASAAAATATAAKTPFAFGDPAFLQLEFDATNSLTQITAGGRSFLSAVTPTFALTATDCTAAFPAFGAGPVTSQFYSVRGPGLGTFPPSYVI
eukprot:SAG22_NODE_1368_length_4585_cov_2.663174_5_plen_428_part_00